MSVTCTKLPDGSVHIQHWKNGKHLAAQASLDTALEAIHLFEASVGPNLSKADRRALSEACGKARGSLSTAILRDLWDGLDDHKLPNLVCYHEETRRKSRTFENDGPDETEDDL